MERIDKLKEKISELERNIKQLRDQFPKHSIPPSMIMRLDDLEDELTKLEKDFKKLSKD